MQTNRDIIDSSITAACEHLCELLGVECTPDVLAHWQTPDGQAALRILRPQLQLLASRALTIAATEQPRSVEQAALAPPVELTLTEQMQTAARTGARRAYARAADHETKQPGIFSQLIGRAGFVLTGAVTLLGLVAYALQNSGGV